MDRTISDATRRVAVDDIVAVETKEFSIGKTALLGDGIWLTYGLLAAVAAAATVGL